MFQYAIVSKVNILYEYSQTTLFSNKFTCYFISYNYLTFLSTIFVPKKKCPTLFLTTAVSRFNRSWHWHHLPASNDSQLQAVFHQRSSTSTVLNKKDARGWIILRPEERKMYNFARGLEKVVGSSSWFSRSSSKSFVTGNRRTATVHIRGTDSSSALVSSLDFCPRWSMIERSRIATRMDTRSYMNIHRSFRWINCDALIAEGRKPVNCGPMTLNIDTHRRVVLELFHLWLECRYVCCCCVSENRTRLWRSLQLSK